MSKILIIEDDAGISRFIELELTYEGYKVEKAFDGKTGLSLALEKDFDLIILDIMLPLLNGFEVLRKIRISKDTPIILLTAKDDTFDKVMGLDKGANDYITKPFEIEELLARIRVGLRTTNRACVESSIRVKNLEVFDKKHQVKYMEKTIDLTKTEYDLLLYLIKNVNIVLSREQIVENVWGYDYQGDTNIVDVYIRYLRGKIDDKFDEKIIHTIRGVGYLIKDEKE